ncbi:hypothetical protein B0H17DRAFT_1337828 [Mycena rosella]|uniref:Uncharacterized protein n=1 Tax=Mycena rosella TaxID=1033263 RepID=A0AAD7CSG2_MYCRO|nr:hypothetical protein B0H17DRAFT_1337828 [Mycena rosella]
MGPTRAIPPSYLLDVAANHKRADAHARLILAQSALHAAAAPSAAAFQLMRIHCRRARRASASAGRASVRASSFPSIFTPTPPVLPRRACVHRSSWCTGCISLHFRTLHRRVRGPPHSAGHSGEAGDVQYSLPLPPSSSSSLRPRPPRPARPSLLRSFDPARTLFPDPLPLPRPIPSPFSPYSAPTVQPPLAPSQRRPSS